MPWGGEGSTPPEVSGPEGGGQRDPVPGQLGRWGLLGGAGLDGRGLVGRGLVYQVGVGGARCRWRGAGPAASSEVAQKLVRGGWSPGDGVDNGQF